MLFLSITIVGELIGSVDWHRTWENWEHASGTFEHVATIVALILGAIATYFKFFRERINEDHLEVRISGKTINVLNERYLLVTVEAKNLALKLFTIDHMGTGVRVGYGEADIGRSPDITDDEFAFRAKVIPYQWKYFRTLKVFEDQFAIEPGESLSDQQLAKLSEYQWPALRLELRVNSKNNTWFTATVIPAFSEAETQGGDHEEVKSRIERERG